MEGNVLVRPEKMPLCHKGSQSLFYTQNGINCHTFSWYKSAVGTKYW